jgi:hypothetical protein
MKVIVIAPCIARQYSNLIYETDRSGYYDDYFARFDKYECPEEWPVRSVHEVKLQRQFYVGAWVNIEHLPKDFLPEQQRTVLIPLQNCEQRYNNTGLSEEGVLRIRTHLFRIIFSSKDASEMIEKERRKFSYLDRDQALYMLGYLLGKAENYKST